GQVKPALYFQVRFRFDLLRDEFAKDHLLGKVLGADHRMVLARRRATRKYADQNGAREKDSSPHRLPLSFPEILKRRSNRPSGASPANANSAAGTAPARTRRLSIEATPRKISSPRPPAPTAAAMVAMPIQVTVAVRSPAKMNEAARGSSI